VTNSEPILVLEDVHAAYLQKEILRGVSFTIHAGEIISLLGENGSGKSTVLKVIAGLLTPSRGTVRYRDQDLNGLDPTQRQQIGIGYLIQGGRVFPNLTVGENFYLAAAQTKKTNTPGSLGDWFPVLRERCADRAGLLSGGQRQMLAIEMVLSQRPDLLLLDEPTAALNAELAIDTVRLLIRYAATTDASAIFVEHQQDILPAQSFRPLTLSHGNLIS